MINLVVIGVACGACVCTAAQWAAGAHVGLLNLAHAPLWIAVPITVACLDAVSYGWHRANHRLPFLWRFHRVHHLDQTPNFSTALRFHPGAPTEIKRMWVAPSVRGIGLGRRLLVELERHARAAGTKVLQLETNRALTEAISLYRQSGFVEVPAFNEEPYGDYWFEKRLEDALD